MLLSDAEVHPALNSRFSGGPTRELGLSTTVPRLQGGAIVGVTEPTAASYARVTVLPAAWPAAADRAVETEVAIPDPTADLGVIVAWVLFTAGVPTVAGVPAEPMDLKAGSSGVSVVCRVEAPDTLTATL